MKHIHPEQLIVRFLSNEASSEEQIELFDWICKSSENQTLFNQYCEIWSKGYKSPLKFDVDSGLKQLHTRIDTTEKAIRKSTAYNQWLTLAASLIILLLAGVFLYQYTAQQQVTPALTWQERKNPHGQKSTIQLTDGTVVKLNSSSQLRFPENFSETQREVYLEGEAFFEVAKDATRPFIVYTGALQTEVLGTSFNIQTSTLQTEVSVATGKVKVTADGKQEILKPYEKAFYSTHQKKLMRSKTSLLTELAWKNNTIVLNNNTLQEVAFILEDWYGVTIQLKNTSLLTCRITGTYQNESLKNILEAISFSTGIKYTLTKKEVLLFGKGCL